MNWSVFAKYLKDGLRGAMVSILPLILQGLTGAQSVMEIVGGLVSAAVGVLAGALKATLPQTSDFLKILNDVLYGFLIAAQPILQNGLSQESKAMYIIGGLGISLLGVLSNVLHDDYSSATGCLKIAKDCIISVINALIPVLQAGLTSGTSLVVLLCSFGHTAASVIGNTLESDLFGLTQPASTTPPASSK